MSIHPRVRHFLLLLILVTMIYGCDSTRVDVTSPDGNLYVQVKSGHGKQLFFVAKYNGGMKFNTTPIGVNIDEVKWGENVVILDSVKRGAVDVEYKWRGVHSKAHNHYNFITIPVLQQKTGEIFSLQVRAFNDGFAYRMIIPGKGERLVSDEAIGWKISNKSLVWFHSDTKDYEDPVISQMAIKIPKNTKMVLPLVAEQPDNTGYIALTEAAVFDYSGYVLKTMGDGLFVADFEDDLDGWVMQDTVTTPWRVAILSQDLNGLVNSDMIHNLCPAPDPELADAEWIRPGRSVWSWWSSGTGDWNQQKQFIDKGSKLGFEYNLIDELWEEWQDGNRDKWAILKELVGYANKRHIKLWVWKYWSEIEDSQTRRDFFKKLANVGIVGVKIDFMDSDSKERMDFYTSTLEDAAFYKLMINFHGANKPTGESRTFPNEMTREGIFGLEQNKAYDEIPPSHNAALPFTRYIAGHGDYTPVTFNPEKLKGTSFCHQLATAIVFTSPITHWADHPDFYLASPALDVIKTIPTVWDETIVLPGSKIGELAAMARRKGNDWYIGILNGGAEKFISIDLSFLDEGHFETIVFSDDLEIPDDMIRQEMVVDKSDKMKIELQAGGGFVARLTKTDLPLNRIEAASDSKYLTQSMLVALKSSNPKGAIYFTMDGSNPTAKSNVYSEPIKVSKPFVLKAAVLSEKKILCFSETRFYLPKAPLIKTVPGIFYQTKKIEIEKIENDAQIYYTLDGSDPSEKSEIYHKPIEIAETTTLKAKYIWKSGYGSKVSEARFVRPEPRNVVLLEKIATGLEYDLYLGSWTDCPDFSTIESVESDTVAHFDIAPIQPREDAFGIQFQGYIKVPQEGLYTFYTASNDGSKFYIGDQLVVDNDGSHAVLEREGQIVLKAGYHPIHLLYFESAGSQDLQVSYSGPSIEKQPVPELVLFHADQPI
jgi:hypothetical protein